MAILVALLSCAFLAGTPGVAAPATDGRGAHAGQPQRGAARALRLRLPQPLGPYSVGVRWDSVSDPTRIDATTGRPRRLPIRIWYPARRDRRRGPAAPYFSPVVQAFAEEALGLPAGLFEIDTHAAEDAPARGHVRGVILAQPGGGSLAAFHTGQLVDLASQGYVVVASDHPHDGIVVEEPDGTLIYEVPNSEDLPLEERVRDAAVVLDALPRLVPQARRDEPVGMFGHSRGGAATPEVMLHDRRVAAGVALDIGTVLFVGGPDSPPGDVVAAGLDRPFGLMCSLDVPCDAPLVADFISRLRGPHPATTLDILHLGYTDFVVFNPQAARADPAVAQIFEQLAPTGTVGSLRAGLRALSEQRRFLSRFMGRHLSGRRWSSLHAVRSGR